MESKNKTPRAIVDSKFPDQLLDGYKAFYYSKLRHERDRYEQLAQEGQKPEVMVISCCDSRAAPEMIFDAVPGQFFVVRNVANIVPPYKPDEEVHGTSAALEFAVQVLKVKHILVMGHGRCGGVTAFRQQYEGLQSEPLSPGDFIGKWMSLLEPSTKDIRCEDMESVAARQKAMEEANIRNAIVNLLTFPCVNILHDKSKIALHGAWFDIASGELWVMDAETGDFHISSG